MISVHFLLLFIFPSAISACSDFWVSDCNLSPDEVILQVPFPGHDGAIRMCQDLCKTQFDCTYWQWSEPQMTCTLLRYSYLSRCRNVSSTSTPEVSTCLSQDSGTCDDFVDEDCQMSGQALFKTDSVIDAFACQEYLQLLGPLVGAEVFFFSDLEGICYLLDSPDRSCVTLSGPATPSPAECVDETTTSTTSTITATTTATTTTTITTTDTKAGNETLIILQSFKVGSY